MNITSKIATEKKMSAEEAASRIKHGEVLGTSGFTPSGHPKKIPVALAERAEKLHAAGQEFKVSLYTGASTGDELDGALARAKALKLRLPYQTNLDIRNGINEGEIEYADMHLSHLSQYVRFGFVDKVTTAIVEAVDVTDDGKVYLTMSSGMSPTFLQCADRIFIELNTACPEGLKEMHDIYIPENPPHRGPIPIVGAGDRVGTPYVQVDPSKIEGIVWTDKLDASYPLRSPGETEKKIAENVIDFLQFEEKMGRIPKGGLPYQSGVGNVANAVLACFATMPGIDPITMYTEVIQDSVFQLMDNDRLKFGSTTALTLSEEGNKRFIKEIDEFKKKVILRPQEISNNPEVIRRLGLISMNTALEVDIFGNVNSTNVLGSKMMNGIGGSGDFTRNAYISIFMASSVAKNGDISSIVPMVSHVDHSEHSVQVIATDQGIVDLRGKSPLNKAREIIAKAAHPDYRDLLTDYLEYGLKNAPSKHIPHFLDKAFDFHRRLAQTGSMKVK